MIPPTNLQKNLIYNFVYFFQIEQDISKRYNNRVVNLMGGNL